MSTSIKAAARCVVVAFAVAAALCLQPVAAESAKTNRNGATPDWSGWWFLQMGRPPGNANAGASGPSGERSDAVRKITPDSFGQPPFKPENQELAKKLLAFELGELKEPPPGAKPYKTCEPFRFTGKFFADPEAGVEFLMTPGRVTIADEAGQLRRIYLDRKMPAEVDETYAGTSVGHWEGQTLVIETTGLSRNTQFMVVGGGIPIGKNVRSTERIHLKESDVLQIDSVVIAPDSLAEPYKSTTLLRRAKNYVPHEFSFCDDTDRYLDPATGDIFFDMTPPADLPPPPQ